MLTFNELSNLQGRVALVTGACGHLGREICDTLAELGAELILVDLNLEKLREFKSELIEKWQTDVKIEVCNLSNQDSRDKLIETVLSQFSSVNILVNNAALTGSSLSTGWAVPYLDQNLDAWREAVEVNLTACFHLTQKMFPLMNNSEGASVINIGSIYGIYGPDWSLYEGTSIGNPAAYAVSKAGLIQLTRWLAKTVSPNVRVNSISPGGIFRNQDLQFVTKYIERTPLGRMANESDFRGPIGILASDLGRYITGQNIIVDGGWGV